MIKNKEEKTRKALLYKREYKGFTIIQKPIEQTTHRGRWTMLNLYIPTKDGEEFKNLSEYSLKDVKINIDLWMVQNDTKIKT